MEMNEIRTLGKKITLFSSSVEHSKLCSVLDKERTTIQARSELILEFENVTLHKASVIFPINVTNGLNFQLTNISVPYTFKNLPFGFVVDLDGLLEPIKDLDITIKPITDTEPQSSLKASFKTGEQYELSGVVAEPIVFYSGQGWSGFLEMSFIEFKVGSRRGYGLIMSGEVYDIPKRPGKLMSLTSCPEHIPLTVQFTDVACQFGEVSGGKGSSLGRLTQLGQENKTFIVPKGIVVSTTAYNQFLTSEILEAVKYLENVTYGNESGDLKNACKRVSSIIEQTSLPKKICHSIIEDLKDLFGDEVSQRKFAVRSSATGEDTSTMSAAGQMDTFLGVQGLEDIFSSVKKCWASQFGHIAVEYKRRNGQVLNSPMAVVIQDMVACEVSGVLFTCDPVTNNPSVITITANYGLGETVVSGSVEPDTFFLRRKDGGKLEVDDIIIGTKHQKIIMKDSGGTVTENVDDQSKNESCLRKEDAERLGKLSLKIENYYKSPRDIEWGILNEKIYILQSGFREGKSIEHALITLQDKIRKAEQNIKYSVIPSLDIKGAFDHLQYHAIRGKFKKLNFSTSTLVTLLGALNDRQVALQANEGPGLWSQKQGCPQGSGSGPMFWNLIADEILAEEFPPDVHRQAFADDFIFHICSGTRECLKILAQQALDIFKTWTDKNQLQISTSKSAYMLIVKFARGPTFKWGTESIKRSSIIKYLGIILYEKLNWAAHIRHQGMKAALTRQRMARIAGATWASSKNIEGYFIPQWKRE
ncbi:putative phosphoenolpyruvate synthase [Araneus ventricosus]|uniref:Putative phosphoenolpyruvate synthase n=1 Tax=Araneus ventricosus TaxID=182803 RepID=A0A4Y2FWW8_ARAVE|nr:putative phosphoenolpyruvate synthase [Araneus ventricosus]